VLDFTLNNVETILVEPNPSCIDSINTFFANRNNVFLHPVAVYDYPKRIKLFCKGASTFVGDLDNSPALTNDNYKQDEKDALYVDAVCFDSIDPGNIDLLCLDIEGSEWFVIKHMKSRPAVLSIETHGKYYVNPYIQEIKNWAKENSYVIWFKDKSDTVYANPQIIPVNLQDKLQLLLKELSLYWRRAKLRKLLSSLAHSFNDLLYAAKRNNLRS